MPNESRVRAELTTEEKAQLDVLGTIKHYSSIIKLITVTQGIDLVCITIRFLFKTIITSEVSINVEFPYS